MRLFLQTMALMMPLCLSALHAMEEGTSPHFRAGAAAALRGNRALRGDDSAPIPSVVAAVHTTPAPPIPGANTQMDPLSLLAAVATTADETPLAGPHGGTAAASSGGMLLRHDPTLSGSPESVAPRATADGLSGRVGGLIGGPLPGAAAAPSGGDTRRGAYVAVPHPLLSLPAISGSEESVVPLSSAAAALREDAVTVAPLYLPSPAPLSAPRGGATAAASGGSARRILPLHHVMAADGSIIDLRREILYMNVNGIPVPIYISPPPAIRPRGVLARGGAMAVAPLYLPPPILTGSAGSVVPLLGAGAAVRGGAVTVVPLSAPRGGAAAASGGAGHAPPALRVETSYGGMPATVLTEEILHKLQDSERSISVEASAVNNGRPHIFLPSVAYRLLDDYIASEKTKGESIPDILYNKSSFREMMRQQEKLQKYPRDRMSVFGYLISLSMAAREFGNPTIQSFYLSPKWDDMPTGKQLEALILTLLTAYDLLFKSV